VREKARATETHQCSQAEWQTSWRRCRHITERERQEKEKDTERKSARKRQTGREKARATPTHQCFQVEWQTSWRRCSCRRCSTSQRERQEKKRKTQRERARERNREGERKPERHRHTSVPRLSGKHLGVDAAAAVVAHHRIQTPHTGIAKKRGRKEKRRGEREVKVSLGTTENCTATPR
jgi:hypothetical protein